MKEGVNLEVKNKDGGKLIGSESSYLLQRFQENNYFNYNI